MSWIVVYLQIALFVGLVWFVVISTVSPQPADAGRRAATVAVVAVAWPVMLLGLVQLVVIVTAHNPPLPAGRRSERRESAQPGL